MKYFLCFPFLLFSCFVSKAQYHVRFKIEKYPAQHIEDSIFIAGNFNGWNPQDQQYFLTKGKEADIQLAAGSYQFKCTRGYWNTVETKLSGADIENRQFKINSDTTIAITIEAWKDDFAETQSCTPPAKMFT